MIFIYALRDPISKAVRYIGKTKNDRTRLKAHISKAKGGHTDHHCARWICALLAQDRAPTLEVLRCIPDSEDWQKAEMDCIAEHRAAGHPLTNMTGGGDGFHDVHPDILKKRGRALRAYLALPKNKAKLVAIALEVGRRPEVRIARSAGVIAAWTDPEKRRRMRAGAASPIAVQRKSAAMKKLNADPDYKAKQSATLKALWATPARRAQAKARVVAMHADPEASARRVAAIRAAYQNPEVKARLAAAMVAARARKAAKQLEGAQC